ncbi:MAG: chorismate synthase, partial [Planctomycetota bacterium]
GAIAKKLIQRAFGGRVIGYVVKVAAIEASVEPPITLDQVERFADGTPNIVRCPDEAAARRMIEAIEGARRDGDSLGGVAEIRAEGVPPGLGEPVFGKLKADLGRALLSLPAVVGVEYGAGFDLAAMRGSEANDVFKSVQGTEAKSDQLPAQRGEIRTRTNRHGGILGGISTGMPIVWRAAVKPTSSLPREQETVDREGNPTTIRTTGRHDPCLLPRFVPMAEAMIALVLADHWLRFIAQTGGSAFAPSA